MQVNNWTLFLNKKINFLLYLYIYIYWYFGNFFFLLQQLVELSTLTRCADPRVQVWKYTFMTFCAVICSVPDLSFGLCFTLLLANIHTVFLIICRNHLMIISHLKSRRVYNLDIGGKMFADFVPLLMLDHRFKQI